MDVACGKPDPECYLTAAARLDVTPGACLVVEDARAGIEAATRAGIEHVIGVHTTRSADALRSATLVVPDLSHVRFHTDGGRLKVVVR